MKLVRFGPPGRERPGVWLAPTLDDPSAQILDVRAMAYDIQDYDPHFFAHNGLARLTGLLQESDLRRVPAAGVRLGAPVPPPSNLVAVGANYAAHAAELQTRAPTRPVFFAKATTSLAGPFDPIRLPPEARRVDIEAELAVVIGREARHVPEARALDFIAGFTILNDVTDRDAQREQGQWFQSKSYETFCPLGPFLVTPDEVKDPHALRIYSKLNDELLQDASTADMLFRVPRLLAELTRHVALRPGDVLATGTPAGIGSARTPPRVLAPGDTVEVGIEGLGYQRNQVIAAGSLP